MAGKKRLLIVTNRFHPQIGGAELNIYLQAKELSRHFDVDVYTPLRDRDPRREIEGSATITRGLNFRNPLRRFPDLSTETFCPGVFFQVLFGAYDIVHFFPSLNLNNKLALLAARLRGVPVFMSMFDLEDYSGLLEQGLSLEKIFENQARSVEQRDRMFEMLSGVFTISSRETENIRKLNPNTQLSTVPILIEEYDQEVDVEDFKRRYGVDPDVPLILCLGRVANLKGQDILIRALPRLRELMGTFHVMVMGRTDYEPEFLAGMEAFVEKEGLQHCVSFTGGVPRADVIAALKSCDVHVLPVRFMNSGAVVVETWAARRPVLHSDMIDPCYVVEGENGYTFKLGNTNDLAEKLAAMLADPAACDAMGARGRELVEKKFLYPHLIQQYLNAYEEFAGVVP